MGSRADFIFLLTLFPTPPHPPFPFTLKRSAGTEHHLARGSESGNVQKLAEILCKWMQNGAAAHGRDVERRDFCPWYLYICTNIRRHSSKRQTQNSLRFARGATRQHVAKAAQRHTRKHTHTPDAGSSNLRSSLSPSVVSFEKILITDGRRATRVPVSLSPR